MPQFYAYIYRDPSRNNEPIYAGKGQDDRAYEHLKNRDKPKKKENKSFMGRLRNMKEAGIEPFIQIFNCESEELAFLFEEEAIDKYGRIDLGKGSLHNHTNGGEGMSGHVQSPETRKKRADAQKGEKNHNYGKPAYNRGKSPSLETRKKQAEANKGQGKGIPKPIVICPHCGKEGGAPQLKRWHFDNCKYTK